MQHDRAYYRALHPGALIELARDEGLNEELAIAITERLAYQLDRRELIGCFHFNEGTKKHA